MSKLQTLKSSLPVLDTRRVQTMQAGSWRTPATIRLRSAATATSGRRPESSSCASTRCASCARHKAGSRRPPLLTTSTRIAGISLCSGGAATGSRCVQPTTVATSSVKNKSDDGEEAYRAGVDGSAFGLTGREF